MLMRKGRPCSVCQKVTHKLLFRDRKLDIAICSKPCESEYIRTVAFDRDKQASMLSYFDAKIAHTKRHENECWATAGFGLLLVAAGFLARNVESFLIGIFPLTFGALSTRYFEDKRNKLAKLRRRIRI